VSFLFRTYNSFECTQEELEDGLLDTGSAAPCTIVEVGRATSAAPKFFQPIKISLRQGESTEFIDGGFGLNNPSHDIFKDIKKRKLNASNDVIDIFASFGTGNSCRPLSGSLSSSWRLLGELQKHTTDVLRAHTAMENESGKDTQTPSFHYYRFDGGGGLGEMRLDHWSGRRRKQLRLRTRPTGEETLVKMDKYVKEYLKSDKVKSELNDLAKNLVRRRRLRTRDRSAWDQYASASSYECSVEGCERNMQTIDLFLAHLGDAHVELLEDARNEVIKGSRKCWTYKDAAG